MIRAGQASDANAIAVLEEEAFGIGAWSPAQVEEELAGDTRDPAGVYFGTNTGSVFASRDEGETWDEVARHLPTILAVEVLEPATAG